MLLAVNQKLDASVQARRLGAAPDTILGICNNAYTICLHHIKCLHCFMRLHALTQGKGGEKANVVHSEVQPAAAAGQLFEAYMYGVGKDERRQSQHARSHEQAPACAHALGVPIAVLINQTPNLACDPCLSTCCRRRHLGLPMLHTPIDSQCSPELVVKSRAYGEVGQVLANGLSEEAKQGLAAKARHADVGGDGPAAR